MKLKDGATITIRRFVDDFGGYRDEKFTLDIDGEQLTNKKRDLNIEQITLMYGYYDFLILVHCCCRYWED